MALIESLGYKQDSPRQVRKRRNVKQQQSAQHKWKYSGNDATYGSSHNDSLQFQQYKENVNVNANVNVHNKDNNNNNNKYLSLPRKSMLSSGIGGFISPIPPKYKENEINKLDISNTNNHHNNQSMNLSPIKPNLLNTLPLNSTLNIPNANNVENDKEIMIIGFPPSEYTFIYRKFRAYGTVIQSKWNKNTLFLEYEYKQNAVRALVENAKWIKNGNLSYMIAVIFAEQAEVEINGENSNQNGRVLNLNQQKTNRNQTSYFGQNYENIEKPQDLHHGPTHILWKIFEFLTTGW